MSSALFNSSFALGYFVGPLLGGVLADLTDFEHTSFFFATLFLILSICYLFFGKVLKENSTE